MTKLSKEEIETIRKRAEAATEGPWFHTNYHVATKPEVHGGYPPNSASICETCDGEYIENYNKADAEFIAHARTDIPKLLAEIERLRSIIKDIRECSDIETAVSELTKVALGDDDDD
ncbi:hypothetical protein [Lederbergia citri]|uniref:Uncharacterized protein n=1 Tax=Lederbergia citri TaxID=2833580 RepID=A0A942TEK4_9BACI|nr:hypothetical protein [Lederbergia citri]MBS4195388.1 hypothetical protein [Lederbergia citri]